MLCPKCGKENNDYVRYCEFCGVDVRDKAPILSAEDQDEIRSGESRYQEYTLSDVPVRKSRKKLILTLSLIGACLVIAVAIFFLVRGMNRNGDQSDQQNNVTNLPLAAGKSVVEDFLSPQSSRKTTRMTVEYQGTYMESVMASDLENKQFYWYQSQSDRNHPDQEMVAELYSTKDRGVLKASVGGKNIDYYLDYDGLREKAAKSAFGPGGENMFNITQEQYDTAMDVYDFVCRNVTQSEDPFALKTLGQKLIKDFDQCGNKKETHETVTVADTSVEARIVTHTFTDAKVLKVMVEDVMAWSKDTIHINDQIDAQLADALSKVDLSQFNSVLEQAGSFKIELKRYYNDKDALMKGELIADVNGMKLRVVLECGADPENTKEITLIISAAMKGQQVEIPVETITLKNESDASQDKIIVSYSGFVLTGTTSFVRDLSSGDFTVDNKMSVPLSSMTGSGAGADAASGLMIPINSAQMPDLNFTLHGNLQTTADSVTMCLDIPDGKGEEIHILFSVSNHASIPELTSTHNILEATAQELKDAFSIGNTVSLPVSGVPNLKI